MKPRMSDISTLVLALAAITLGVRSVRTNNRGVATAGALSVTPSAIPDWASIATTGQWLGSARAPLKIVEFADFTCIHCAEQHVILEQLRAEFPDQVVVVFKHFPLAAPGYELALASECIAPHGKFAEFQSAAFALRAAGTTAARWWEVTRAAGIADSTMIETCVRSRQGSSEVETDVSDGRKLSLVGTPAMLLNGVLRRGVVPIELLRAAIVEQRDQEFPIPASFRK